MQKIPEQVTEPTLRDSGEVPYRAAVLGTLSSGKRCPAHDDRVEPTSRLRGAAGDGQTTRRAGKAEPNATLSLVCGSTCEIGDHWVAERSHPCLGQRVDDYLEICRPPLRPACGIGMAVKRIADLTLQQNRQPHDRNFSAAVGSMHRCAVASIR
jgi:hypothetical protein